MHKSGTHVKTECLYDSLREAARNSAALALPLTRINSYGQGINVKGEVRLDELNSKVFYQVKRWLASPQRRLDIGIDWPLLISKYSRVAPKRFELAIWHREILCGIALGQPTWSGGKLRLDFIEASPEKTPLSGLVTELTLLNLIFYARAIGATQLRIMNPVSEKIKAWYIQSAFGFAYDSTGDFCYRNL